MLERVGFAALVVLGIGLFSLLVLFRPFFWIPSGSMKPTLLVGDYLIVNKLAYGLSGAQCPLGLCPLDWSLYRVPPKRGDVVVFRHPVQDSDFIKRVIGLPGDRIQMTNGAVHINGAPVALEAAPDFVEGYRKQGPLQLYPTCSNRPVDEGGTCVKERWVETLPGGQRHQILNVRDGAFADNTEIFEVPEGHYFMLGDSRDNSNDSRYPQSNGGLGFVPQENLIGKARWVLFSSAGQFIADITSWRNDRYLQEIQ